MVPQELTAEFNFLLRLCDPDNHDACFLAQDLNLMQKAGDSNGIIGVMPYAWYIN